LRIGAAQLSGAVDDRDFFLAQATAHDHDGDEEDAAEEEREDERHHDEHLLADAGEVFAFEYSKHLVHHATSCRASPVFSMKICSSDGEATSNLRMRSRPTEACRISCGSAPSLSASSASLLLIVARFTFGSVPRNAPSPSKSMCSVFLPKEPRTWSSVPSSTTLPRWIRMMSSAIF